MQDLKTLFASFGIDLASLGVNFGALTTNRVLTFESSVASNGLDQNMIAALQQLGADQTEINNIRNLVFVQDINKVASSYHSGFNDPVFNNAVTSFSNSLTPQAVPEPSSILLVICGLLFIGLRRSRVLLCSLGVTSKFNRQLVIVG